MLKSKLLNNVLALYLAQGLNFLLPLLMLPHLTRALGPDAFGQIMFAQSFIGYALIVTEYGYSLSATRDVSIARGKSKEIAKIFWSTMAAKCVLFLTSSLIITILIMVIPLFQLQWKIFAVCGLTLLGNVFLPNWYFQGIEKMWALAFVQIMTKAVTLCLIFYYVHSEEDLILTALIISAPTLLACIICLFVIKKIAPVEFHRPSTKDIKNSLCGSWNLFVSSAAGSFYLTSNAFILGFVSDSASVGKYSLANKIALAVHGLMSPLIQSIYPKMSSIAAAGENGSNILVIKKMLSLVIALSICGSIGLFFLADALVTLIGGNKFADAGKVLRIMAALPFVLSIATIFSQLIMVNYGLTRELSKIYMAVAALNAIILAPLVLYFQQYGAAVSLMIIEVIGPLLMFKALQAARVNLLNFSRA